MQLEGSPECNNARDVAEDNKVTHTPCGEIVRSVAKGGVIDYSEVGKATSG
jgi:hypothetical protein